MLPSSCLAFVLTAPIVFAPQAQQSASELATPPLPTTHVPPPQVTPGAGASVRVALVRSWLDGGASAWFELALNWWHYGATPLTLDYTFAGSTPVTYAGLVATHADVLVLSDCAGGLQQLSAAEIAAIQAYALDGHDIVATFATFAWSTYDNRALAPLFGLDPQSISTSAPQISNHFSVLKPWHPLLTNLGSHSWTSQGYPFTQACVDGVWSSNELAGAKIFGQADGFEAVFTYYRHARYNAVYFSNMPEFFGAAKDLQLLYNALTLNTLSASPVKHP